MSTMKNESQDPNEAVMDGGAPTEEEARLAAELDAEGADGAQDDDDGADDTAAAEATAPAEAPAPAAQVEHAQPAEAARPEPPKDFAAELAAAEEAYNDGDIDAVELNRRTRELTLAEADYRTELREWERSQSAVAEASKNAAANEWNTAALAFEAQHADFLGNPLRHKVMQDAIALVQQRNPSIDSATLLQDAYQIAVDYTGYVAPAAAPGEREAVGKALGDRRPPGATQTLGDAPAARNEQIRGNESFTSLDGLGIQDLETAFANMSPAQQEAYLADAPGATATGRD